MIEAPQSIESLTLEIKRELTINASLAVTFEALLEQIGPSNSLPDGTPMPMIVEPWPGGRWYRDLGNHDGHFWGHVQAIKRPTLLEFCGPMFASFPFISNVQYRLSEANGVTTIKFQHVALGLPPEAVRANVGKGWNWIFERIKRDAESR